MSDQSGPIYEVTLSVDREVAGDIDEWLAAHVAEMLLIPGFTGAKIYALEDDQDRVRRVTHYYLDSDESLQQYLDGPAAVMRQSTIERFGERFEAGRRVMRETGDSEESLVPKPHCLNCGTVLDGQYCGNCGQRARSRLISIWELVRDAFGDILDVDSRLWRTLVPLAVRPGKLTKDYLQGRRARFMPPFRMYLVLSLAFFLVAFFDPQKELGILFEPAPETAEDATIADDQEVSDDARDTREEVLRELANEGIVVTPPAPDETDEESASGLVISIDNGEAGAQCEFDDFDATEMPAWLARRLTKERLIVICEKMIAKDGEGLKGFLDKLLENVPAGLFLLLPLMALVLNLLYPLSKRYYVEHLLFVVHYHAFIFLALTVQILFARAASLVGAPDAAGNAAMFAVSLYIPVYLYKSQRRVYEQGRFVTLLKFLFLLVAYLIGLALILGSVAIFAAFSI